MTIGTIDGNLITLQSAEYQQALLTETLGTIAISASYNKSTPIIKSISIPQQVSWSCTDIPLSSFVTINQIYIKNLITEQRVGLLEEPHVNHDQYSLELLKEKIQTALNNMGISGFTQATTLSDDFAAFSYSMTGLPLTVAMSTFEYEVSGVPITLYFSQIENVGVILATDIIYITPAFFGLETFAEGVYEIELSLHLDHGYIVQFSGCYFLDVTMKCRLGLTSDFECGLNTAQMQYLMLHYSLTEASNCQCECDKMHTIYEFLNKSLPLNSKTQNCGCS